MISRLFRLVRDSDESGITGTGVVAHGVRWPDGRVALWWRPVPGTTETSVADWPSIEAMVRVHGHGGSTRVEWDGGAPDAATRS